MSEGPSSFDLLVDGQPLDPGTFHMHFQAEPYPGGHEYRLVISDADILQQAIRTFGLGSHTIVSETQARSFMSFVPPLMSLKCGRHQTQYYGNTMSEIAVNEKECVMSGCCSPVVSRPATLPDPRNGI